MLLAVNNRFENIRKAGIAIIGIAMLVVVLFSAIFVTVETFHNCDGEDCPICEMIHQCENNLNQLGDGTVPMLIALVLMIIFINSDVLSGDFFPHYTLVTARVRLND